MALSSADIRIVFMEPAGDEHWSVSMIRQMPRDRETKTKERRHSRLIMSVNAQLFAEDLKERIKAIPFVSRTDRHCHPFVGKSTAVILPKNEEDPRRSEEHGAALKNCFDFVVFSHGNHSLSVVALVFCLHILLYKNRDFGTRKSKLFLIF